MKGEYDYDYNAVVDRWVDGDTVYLQVDVGFRFKATLDFRLYGIDTPERGQPGHDAAVSAVNQLAPAGTAVYIKTYKDPDKYGRWLVEVQVGGKSINQALLDAGLAVPYFGGHKG